MMIKYSIFNQAGKLAWQVIMPENMGESWVEERIAAKTWGEPGTFSIQREVASQEEDPRWIKLRAERNSRLTETDWTVLPDAPLTSSKKQKFLQYRQALRDLPANENLNIENPNWPKKP